MPDQVPVKGSDASVYNVMTDTIGTQEVQRVKAGWGVDGVYTDTTISTGLPIQPQYEEVSSTAAALNADLVPSKDVRAYRTVCFQLTGTWSGTVAAQGSNDGTTWLTLNTYDVGSPAVGYTTRTSNSNYYAALSGFRYFRLRITAYTSGTVGHVTEFTQMPPIWALPNVSPSVTPVNSAYTPADAMANANYNGIMADPMLFNGATWDRQRTPAVFKSATATASGNTALWTPTTGKKFRLMRYRLEITANAAWATGGVITTAFQDATTDMGLQHSVFIPATAGTVMGADYNTGWVDLGNGRLSSAINQVLNVNLSAALTSGTCRVVVAGTEE